jgi:hypothetical protein
LRISTGFVRSAGGSQTASADRGVLRRDFLPAASLSAGESGSAMRVVLIAGHHQLR